MSEELRPRQTQAHQPGREDAMQPKPDSAPRFPGSGRLDGKVALITGGDSGIGRAVARAMAREGADIAIACLEEHADARETCGHVADEGREALAIAGDIGDPEHAKALVAKVLERFGRLDILVNNAAEQHECKDLTQITPAQLERTFRSNVFGYFYVTQAALPALRESRGVIVNSTSVTAYRGSPKLIDYAATRGAIVAFTRSLSIALQKDGVRVNAVAPGPIWTPLIPASFDEERTATHGSGAPMQRAGQPYEIAPSYVFLASDDAAYMSGQVLHPNGGEIIGG
jgi:NAD(P)-dependent dehydrogenase (short-subunit alcohol dehydrogenase family)